MLISPQELTYFIELSNTLNFTRAAERLGITQPSLSMAIQRLEHSLEVPLVIRHKQGITFTQAGKQLLSHSKQLQQYWSEVKAKTLASHLETQGSFIIGCHPTVAQHSLSSFFAHILEQYPKLELTLNHDISRKITERVISLEIDIGISVNPIKHPDLVIRKLCDDQVTLWHGSGKRNTQQFNSTHTTIICDPQLAQTQYILDSCKKQGLNYKRIVSTNSLEVVASFTASGSGIGILPTRVVKALYPKKLNRVPNAPVYNDEICVLYRGENKNIKAIQVIVETMREHAK